MKQSEFVSTIINDLNGLSKDTHISKRHILFIGQMNAKFLLSQKMSDRSLFRKNSLFRTIKCLKLEKSSPIECLGVEIPSCTTIMKSKEKIKGLLYGKYGNSIISVTTVDGGEEFKKTTIGKYKSDIKRPFAKYLSKGRYYYESEGYLYFPESEIEAVDVTYIPYDESEVANQSDCSDDCVCKSIWDYEFMCSDDLIQAVRSATLREVSMKLGIPIDENPNMDSNIKSKTIN